jgi:N-acetyl-alpha-D-muramate 1-phosphate uridylyltransferase
MIPIAILAGGLAKRLRPLSDQTPKSLIEVAGKPFIAHQLCSLRRKGLERVVLCVGYLGERIEAFVGNGAAFGIEVVYSHERQDLLGTGGALRKALDLLGDEFLVQYGDSYLDISYASVVRAFRDSRRQALMTVFRNEGRWDTSNVEFVDGEIRNYDKRQQTPAMAFIDYGLGVFRADALRRWPAGQGIDLADIYRSLLVDRELAGYEVHRRFYEIGSMEGLIETDRYLRMRATL